jgi:hypothetical protein
LSISNTPTVVLYNAVSLLLLNPLELLNPSVKMAGSSEAGALLLLLPLPPPPRAAVGAAVGASVAKQLVVLSASATKPSLHAHSYVLFLDLAQYVEATSQPWEPPSQGCSVGMWVGMWVGALVGALVGEAVGTPSSSAV